MRNNLNGMLLLIVNRRNALVHFFLHLLNSIDFTFHFSKSKFLQSLPFIKLFCCSWDCGRNAIKNFLFFNSFLLLWRVHLFFNGVNCDDIQVMVYWKSNWFYLHWNLSMLVVYLCDVFKVIFDVHWNVLCSMRNFFNFHVLLHFPW